MLPTFERPSGDLDTGTVTHSRPAGERTVVVDCWTTQDAKQWRAAVTKTIQVSTHVEGGGTAVTVEVTQFLVPRLPTFARLDVSSGLLVEG